MEKFGEFIPKLKSRVGGPETTEAASNKPGGKKKRKK